MRGSPSVATAETRDSRSVSRLFPHASRALVLTSLSLLMQSPAPASTAVDQILVVTRTGAGENNDADNPFQFCSSPGLCWTLDNPAIDDLELGRVDEFLLDVAPLTVGEITEVTLRPAPGSGQDAWKPTCLAVLLDGDLLYCNDQLDDFIGSDPGDLAAFTDPNVTFQGCPGCYASVLTHGPMVGHTTSSSARVWFRTASRLPVQILYGLQPDLSDFALTASHTTELDDDFTGVLDLEGLEPDSRYYYQVQVDGVAESPPGISLRTAPVAGGVFNVALGSCTREDVFAEQPIFQSIQTHEPEMLLMIGDNHYADTTDPARLDFFYRLSRGITDRAVLLAVTPTWAVWDDHDFTGNDSLGSAPQKERSLAAFKRYWANPSYATDGLDGIWSNIVWGDVEFFLLDGRYYRDDPNEPNPSLLGPDQLAWLLAGLDASTATFKVLVSGSQWTPSGSTDSWASYDAEREAILDHVMESGIAGVVLVSGDVHRAEVRRLRDRSSTTYPVWEFTSSPLANTNASCPASPSPPETLLFCEDATRYFGLLRFDTGSDPPRLTYETRDETDLLLHSVTLTLDELSLTVFADGFESGDTSAWSNTVQ